MDGGVSQARARRSRAKTPRALQETLLEALAGDSTGTHVDIFPKTEGRLANSSGTESPRSRQVQSQESPGLAGDTTRAPARKRQLGVEVESDHLPAKIARPARIARPAGTQQPGVGDEGGE